MVVKGFYLRRSRFRIVCHRFSFRCSGMLLLHVVRGLRWRRRRGHNWLLLHNVVVMVVYVVVMVVVVVRLLRLLLILLTLLVVLN